MAFVFINIYVSAYKIDKHFNVLNFHLEYEINENT